MARSLLILAVLALSFAACNKADETESPEDKLRGGQWRRNSLRVTYRFGTKDTTVDGLKLLDSCKRDNSLEFKANHLGTEHRNYRCSAGDPETYDFEWEVYNSGANMRIYTLQETFSGKPIDAAIQELSSNQLSLRYQLYNQNPLTQRTDTVTCVDVFRK